MKSRIKKKIERNTKGGGQDEITLKKKSGKKC